MTLPAHGFGAIPAPPNPADIGIAKHPQYATIAAYVPSIVEINPATSAAFSVSEINGDEFGVEVST